MDRGICSIGIDGVLTKIIATHAQVLIARMARYAIELRASPSELPRSRLPPPIASDTNKSGQSEAQERQGCGHRHSKKIDRVIRSEGRGVPPHHSLDQQRGRWLRLDRLQGDELVMTQDLTAGCSTRRRHRTRSKTSTRGTHPIPARSHHGAGIAQDSKRTCEC